MVKIIVYILSILTKIKEKNTFKRLKKNGIKNQKIVLCFHGIFIDDCESVYSIYSDKFYEIIKKYTNLFISIDDISSHNGIVLTFDDVKESVYSYAYPLLKKMKIPFTIFITTNYIDKKGYLSSEQVKELSQDNLCTIGSHMCTHRKTREMSNKEITNEWLESRQIIEKIIGRQIFHAALPYGSVSSCTNKSIRLGLQCGYKTVSTTQSLTYHSGRVIPRFVYQNNKEFVLE